MADSFTKSSTTRKLIVRDSITFLSLATITIVLFVVTLFLFRSFQEHRAELAVRWSDRGLTALRQNRPEQAITCYRTALSYAPGEWNYELSLAEALARANRTEEAYNYFIGLREIRPGDGFINLQLAHLAASKQDVQAAVNFYRASIYGDWEGDGAKRRREVRLELARYLIEQKRPEMAKTELLVVGGNAPDDPNLDATLGHLLEQAAAPSEAMDFFQRALTVQPDNPVVLSQAGRLAYRLGDYKAAVSLLERSAEARSGDEKNAGILAKARRILQLIPSELLPSHERVDRILTDRTIAKARWNTCSSSTHAGASQSSLQTLAARWMGPDATTSRSALLHDSDKQRSALQLIYDTEIQTRQFCGAPTGDDELLLRLAQDNAAKGGSH